MKITIDVPEPLFNVGDRVQIAHVMAGDDVLGGVVQMIIFNLSIAVDKTVVYPLEQGIKYSVVLDNGFRSKFYGYQIEPAPEAAHD